MSTPSKERRSAPRREDSAVRFRWAGAKQTEPVDNYSAAGVKLLTSRSAPVGSLVELELQHADGTSLGLMATVRRVDRAHRRNGGDRRLGLSVEFRGVSDAARRTLDQWLLAREAFNASAEGAEAGSSGPQQHEGRLWEAEVVDQSQTPSGARKVVQVDAVVADLFEARPGSRANDEPGPTSEPVGASTGEQESSQTGVVAQQEQLIAELHHRLARAEAVASEALAKLAGAEERLRHLGVYESGRSGTDDTDGTDGTDDAVDTDDTDGSTQEAGRESKLNESSENPRSEPVTAVSSPLMVDALLDSAEVHATDAPAEVDSEAGSRPISASVKALEGVSFTSVVNDKLALDEGVPPELDEFIEVTFDIETDVESEDQAVTPGQAEDEDEALKTRAFSQELLAAAREASEHSTIPADHDDEISFKDVAEESDEESSVESLVEPPDGPDSGASAFEFSAQAVEPTEEELVAEASVGSAEVSEPEAVAATESVGFIGAIPPESANAQVWPELELEPSEAMTVALEMPAPGVAQERAESDAAPDGDSDDLSDGSGWMLDPAVKELADDIGAEEIEVDQPEEAFNEVEPAAAATTKAPPVTFREVPSREGMVEAMRAGSIVRTERFNRLEPVSRADIQVSDFLLETADIGELETLSKGSVELDQLHKVLYVFFQRGLIEIEPG